MGEMSFISKNEASADVISEEADSNLKSMLQGETCPECPSILAFEEGCQKCYSCGYSKC